MELFYEISVPDNSKPKYLFLDEIQLIENWDKLVRRLAESGEFKIYISGSSSKLLSREISTSLRGRNLDYLVMPFSFGEFLRIRGYELNKLRIEGYTEKKGLILNQLKEYLKFGGYPEIVLNNDSKSNLKILLSYYNTIFYKDIAERFKVNDLSLLDAFLRQLVSSTSKYFSVSSSYKFLKELGYNISKKKLLSLLYAANQVFFAFPVPLMTKSLKRQRVNLKKIYIVDNGIITALNSEESIGKLMENACFINLISRKESEQFEISYWKEYGKADGKEVDFVVYDALNVRELIQVSYISSKEELNKREESALLLASKELNCNNLSVITWDYESLEKVEGKKSDLYPCGNGSWT